MLLQKTAFYFHCGSSHTGCCVRVAQTVIPGHWTEISCKDLPEIPMQHFSNNCGVFVLMYGLYISLGVAFDFSEVSLQIFVQHICFATQYKNRILNIVVSFFFFKANMSRIRKWWCVLLLEDSGSPTDRKRHRKDAEVEGPCEVKTAMDPTGGLADLPPEVLSHILLDVVYEEGDKAFHTLSLVCKKFNETVHYLCFLKKAHFAWLDSVVDWKSVNPDVREEYRVAFKLTRCDACGFLYKKTPLDIAAMERRGSLLRSIQIDNLMASVLWTATIVGMSNRGMSNRGMSNRGMSNRGMSFDFEHKPLMTN
ncbi:uncharacterized protein LOC143750397 isoform X1 [Siphateles boraxobius]|uniref:uncharacterized protein LOC143750397 isoform X1 n=1 Tax=Siphateles boraxobius TaxID=180520 RepID=UPI004062D7C8